MTMGMRTADRNTGARLLDLSDYTAKMHYTQLLTISSGGSLTLPGINPQDYCAFMIPCFSFGYPADFQQQYMQQQRPAMMVKTYISGSTVVWEIPPTYFTPNTYQLLVVRYQ